MTKTMYLPVDMDYFNDTDAYLVVERRQERATDLIKASRPNVSDSANLAEELNLKANRAEDYTTGHYIIKVANVEELVPYPTMMEQK